MFNHVTYLNKATVTVLLNQFSQQIVKLIILIGISQKADIYLHHGSGRSF